MWPIEKRDAASASASSSSMSTETLVFSFHACMCLIDCCAGGRSTSPRHISMVSSMPSPSDWRRSATSRSGNFSGNSFSPPCSVSKYSQITGES